MFIDCSAVQKQRVNKDRIALLKDLQYRCGSKARYRPIQGHPGGSTDATLSAQQPNLTQSVAEPRRLH